MNAEVGFNVGDEFYKALGGSHVLPPGSLTLIGHPRGWNPRPLISELVHRAVNHPEAEPHRPEVRQLEVFDAHHLEDTVLPDLFSAATAGRLIGFTLDCSSMLRPLGGGSINKAMSAIRQAATTLQVPAIVTLAFNRFLESPLEEPQNAVYDVGEVANLHADLELFLLGHAYVGGKDSWYVKVGKCRYKLSDEERRLGVVRQ